MIYAKLNFAVQNLRDGLRNQNVKWHGETSHQLLRLPGSLTLLLSSCCHSACKISPTAKAKYFPLQGFGIGIKAGIRFGTGLSPPCPQTYKHAEYLILRKHIIRSCLEPLKAVDSTSDLRAWNLRSAMHKSPFHTRKNLRLRIFLTLVLFWKCESTVQLWWDGYFHQNGRTGKSRKT